MGGGRASLRVRADYARCVSEAETQARDGWEANLAMQADTRESGLASKGGVGPPHST